MAYKNFKKTQGKDFNFFQKVPVSWTQFGAPDGYSATDGYGPDLIIMFPTQSIMFLNEGTGVIEVSFNGTTVHAELDSTKPSASLVFNHRVVSMIWLRVKAGSSGPILVAVTSW